MVGAVLWASKPVIPAQHPHCRSFLWALRNDALPASLQFQVELLDPTKHRREAFDCGVDSLNVFLKTRANREVQVFASACYVLVPVGEPARIAGYYTLSATTISLKEVQLEVKSAPAERPWRREDIVGEHRGTK